MNKNQVNEYQSQIHILFQQFCLPGDWNPGRNLSSQTVKKDEKYSLDQDIQKKQR
jgi:hypothetical protein